MNTYVITRKSDGVEVYRYQNDTLIELGGFDMATYDYTLLQAPAPTTPTGSVKITRLAFLNRFNDSEAIRIDLASIGATVQAASMRRYMQKVNAATFIDLMRPDARAGVLALEQANLLDAPGRAATILDTPPTDTETYKGSE